MQFQYQAGFSLQGQLEFYSNTLYQKHQAFL